VTPNIPREFVTNSRVIIICNDWKTLNHNVAALQDRGHVLVFQPSAAEVHAQAGTWFDDREIYEWFGAHVHRIREPSFRHYGVAAASVRNPTVAQCTVVQKFATWRKR
jgi:hypothetical protein